MEELEPIEDGLATLQAIDFTRLEALQLTVATFAGTPQKTETIMERAETFLAFLKGEPQDD